LLSLFTSIEYLNVLNLKLKTDLMTYMNSLNGGLNSRFSLKSVFATLFTLIIFIAVFFVADMAQKRITELNAKNSSLNEELRDLKDQIGGIAERNRELIELNTRLVEENLALKKDVNSLRLGALGINPEEVDIKLIKVSDSFWTDANFRYNIEEIYITPEIADLSVQNINIPGDFWFLMIKVSVSDTRGFGGVLTPTVTNYLNLVADSKSLSPFTANYLSLSPGQDSEQFVGFAVEENITQFIIRFGSALESKTLSFDLGTDSTDDLRGVFLLREGYLRQFEE
jgi:hypothetical protein